MGDHGAADDGAIEDLVVAVLAVNRWSVEKVFALRDRLARERLFDLDFLASNDAETIGERLKAAGYARGAYLNWLLADRLIEMARLLPADRRQHLRELVGKGDVAGLNELVRHLKGVGPVVARQYLILRDLGE